MNWNISMNYITYNYWMFLSKLSLSKAINESNIIVIISKCFSVIYLLTVNEYRSIQNIWMYTSYKKLYGFIEI